MKNYKTLEELNQDYTVIRTQNEASSKHNNLDVTDIYVNDWGLLQYGIYFNKFDNVYNVVSMTSGNKKYNITAYELDSFIMDELNKQLELFVNAGRL
ncbi:hypothetical protein LSA2308_00184 [Staphylococcus phage LSA2308]|nr:hypothetical protein LSA2308_00004 [Staphylococcus phage LSA2308]QQO38204.1 hypothetical protein LSA2308_00184 [Staphylococcus phage LSA2308]USZ62828.1 hypothetical protein LSA2311_orf00020 [Staphylococcus phage LSA2311]USZ63006.1 hypothetical protein LSA2311_orf00199 [Staphylococcus phage LSA2311]